MASPLRVLIIEDNPDDAELMILHLTEAGFQPDWQRVETEVDYLSALDLSPGLILSDWSLPHFSGLRALQLLNECGLDIPFIIVSGRIGEETAVDALRNGADDYVLKDRPARLGESVHRALEDNQLRLERKQAEEALRVSEERYRKLFDYAPDGILITDCEDYYIDANASMCRMLGYTRDELIGPALSVIKAKSNQFREWQLQRKDGSVFTAEVIATTMPDGNLLAMIRDITKRKRAEEVLRESEESLRALFDTMTSGCAIYEVRNDGSSGGDYIVKDFNASSLAIEGKTKEEVVGKSLLELRPTIDEYGLISVFQKVWQSGEPSFFLPSIYVDENFARWYENRVFKMSTGEIVALYDDVTERMQAEEALRRRLVELETLHTVSGALRTAQTRDEALHILLDETLAALETDSGIIWLYDPDSGELHPTGSRGWFQSIGLTPLRPGESLVGAVFANGETHVSPDLARDPLVRQPGRSMTPAGWGGICVPIHTGQITIGVLLVSVPPGHPVTTQQVELLESLAEMGGAALHRMSLHEETVRQLDRLQAMHRVDQAISSGTDLRMTLNVLLEHVATQLEVDATDVLLLSPHTLTLEPAAGRGFRTRAAETVPIRLGEGLAGRAALERRAVQAVEPAQMQESPQPAALWGVEGFVAYHAVPLIAKGQVIGVLEVFHRAPLAAGEDWVGLLETLAGQAAIAIENAQLFDHLQRSNVDLALAYDATIEGWSHALDLRDKETEGHTRRVAEMTMRLARAVGIADAELVHIRRGALLHDIGKMGVPDCILLKPGPLTEEEWVIMRRHPQLAYDLLAPIDYLRPALDIPFCHHERWDGTGYPRGLAGEQISPAARLFAVVDVWDALRSDRPYREGWTDEKALEHIRSAAGTHFDPKAVELFLDALNEGAGYQ